MKLFNLKKTAVGAAALAAALLGATGANAAIVDGSFEAQGASTSSYCYFLGNYAPACGAGAWTGGGNTSGLQTETNTAWPGIGSPAGSYYAFIQSGFGAAGSISQSLTLATGAYDFSWLAAGRAGYGGNQGYTVTLNGSTGPITLASGATTTNQGFTAVSSGKTVLTGGTYTLTFQALDSGSDNTAFIDAVSVAAVPEPATWGMMLLGFGMVGAGLRRRRTATKGLLARA